MGAIAGAREAVAVGCTVSGGRRGHWTRAARAHRHHGALRGARPALCACTVSAEGGVAQPRSIRPASTDGVASRRPSLARVRRACVDGAKVRTSREASAALALRRRETAGAPGKAPAASNSFQNILFYVWWRKKKEEQR